MDYLPYILLSATGIVAGVLGGLLGIGGSSVMLPAMVLIFGLTVGGVEQIHQYQAAAMIVNFLLITPSVAAHLRNKAVWPKVWRLMAPAALAGIVLGVIASFWFSKERATWLRLGVGLFFVYVCFQNVFRLTLPWLLGRVRGRLVPIVAAGVTVAGVAGAAAQAWRVPGYRVGWLLSGLGVVLVYAAFLAAHRTVRLGRTEGLPRETVEAGAAWPKLAVGLPMGIMAGLLGIGGGALAVPAQQIVLHMPLRNAIATSATTIMTISWLGAILKNAMLSDPDGTVGRSLVLAACLAPTAMIGSYVGGHLTHKLPLRAVRIAFIALMVYSSAKMFGWV